MEDEWEEGWFGLNGRRINERRIAKLVYPANPNNLQDSLAKGGKRPTGWFSMASEEVTSFSAGASNARRKFATP